MKKSSALLPRGLSCTLAPFAALSLLLSIPGGLVAPVQSYAQAVDDGAEVLTRGPVHEAFAATISFKSTPGILVPKAPPAAIEELPPDQRPDGANVTWIPGYWAWDEDSSGFIWVSGIWRNLPPGRQWMPGYWSESGQEFQWISGYWADEAAEEVEYLDEPPASLEAGPNSDAPSRNHSWVPGNWRWRGSAYAWQGGYWDEVQPEWVWTPSYYTSTPRGYVYVDGYYDYDVPRRGLIFAPVRFRGDRYYEPDYSYRPSVVISFGAVLNHLFLRPRSHHYYFGDYYAPEYRRSGYYSSSNYYSGGHGYDPIYAHERWQHRDDSGWDRRNEDNFAYFRDHQDERPPHTFSAFAGFLSRPDRNRRVEEGFASRLDDYAGRQENNKLRFKSLDDGEKQRFARKGKELREFAETRKKDGGRDRDREERESSSPDRNNKDGDGSRKQGSSKSKALKSPVAAVTGAGGGGQGDTPPSRRNGTPRDDRSDGKKEPAPETARKDAESGRPREDKKPNQDRDSKGKAKPEKEAQPGGSADQRDSKGKPTGDSKDQTRGDVPKKDPREEGNRKDNENRKDNDKPESRGGSRPEGPERKSSPEPKRELKTEPRRESNPEPKRESKAENKRDAPRPEPKSEPKREPAPKRESKSKSEPRREAPPQQESKPQPKREPKPQPSKPQEQNRQPKAQPKPQQPQQPQQPAKAPGSTKKSGGGESGGEAGESKEKGKKSKG